MATPAAILDVTVAVDTTKGTVALKSFDKTLRATGQTTTKAGRYTNDLNRRTGMLGGTLRRAAGYAAGAAAAYLSISQAKAAVTATQDLAKVTAGLNRNLGLSVERASEWGAVAKSRDIDARSLNMSFTTLSRRITDLSKGSTEAKDSFADIGVTQKQLEQTNGDFNKQLLLVADAFGEAEGGAKRQQAAQKLLGRGYQTLLPLFSEGADSLKEQLGWADKFGATLSDKTLKAQMDLVMAQRESKVAMLGLQIAFTKMLTPALETANKEFQKIAQIMGSDELTQAEKFERVAKIIGKWAEKAFDAFVAVLPKIVEAAGNKAPQVAEAFAKGFINADIWGRLFLGGWLFTKLGGAAAFRNAGSRSGKFFGRGFIVGALLALPLLLPEAFKFGKKLGHKIKQGLRKVEPIQDIAQGIEDLFNLTERLDRKEVIEGIRIGAKTDQLSIDEALDALKKVGVGARKANEIVAKAFGFGEEQTEKSNRGVRESVDKTSKHVTDKTRDMSNKSGNAHQDLTRKATRTSTEMSQRVSGNVNNMVNAVGNGYNRLKDNTNKALKAFSAKPVNFTIVDGKKVGTSGLQRGGHINTGKSSGDSVPAMLERGEYVLNRNAVAGIGKDRLDAINFGHLARFQKGGGVGQVVEALGPVDMPPFRYDAAHAGGNRHLHLAMSSPAAIVAFGRRLQQAGYMVSEHPAFGGVGGMHAPGGYHYTNQAIDINTPNDETISEIRKVVAMLGGAAGGTFTELARLILKGPKGPLRNMGQAGLDKVRAAANKFLSKHSTVEGAESAGGQFDKGELMRLWVQVNKGQGDPNLMAAIALAESAGNPRAVSYAGARGLWQIMPFHGGGDRLFEPAYNAMKAGQVLASQGLGAWDVYTGKGGGGQSYLNYMQKGGFAGSFARGGPVLRDGYAKVHKGEHITPANKRPQVNINIADGMGWLADFIDVSIDDATPDIIEATLREGGKNLTRSKQLAGKAGR